VRGGEEKRKTSIQSIQKLHGVPRLYTEKGERGEISGRKPSEKMRDAGALSM